MDVIRVSLSQDRLVTDGVGVQTSRQRGPGGEEPLAALRKSYGGRAQRPPYSPKMLILAPPENVPPKLDLSKKLRAPKGRPSIRGL